MSNFRTHGYDVVLQVSAAQLLEILQPEMDGLPNLRFEVEFPDFFEDVAVDFELSPNAGSSLSVDFLTEIENGVRLTFHITCQATFPQGSLSFSADFVVRHPITIVERLPARQCLIVNFAEDLDPAGFEVFLGGFFWGRDEIPPLPSDDDWQELFPTEDAWETFQTRLAEEIASRFMQHLETEVRAFQSDALCFSLDPAGSEQAELVPSAVDFLVIPSSADLLDGTLILLITTHGGTPGDRSAFETATRDYYPDTDVLLLLGNDLILRRIVCPALLEHWGPEDGGEVYVEDYFEFDEAGSATLHRNIDVSRWTEEPIDSAEFVNLTLNFVDDRVEISGQILTSGYGWNCVCYFSGSVTGYVGADGIPRISAQLEPGHAELRYESWYHALTELGLFLLLPFISLAITGPVRQTAQAVLEAMVLSVFRCVFPAISENLPFPFLADAGVDAVVLDDIAVFCRVPPPEEEEAAARPDVWIAGLLEVTDTGNPNTTVKRPLGPVEVITTTFEKAHAGSFRASTRHLTAPIGYRWFLGDEELDGSGHVTADGSRVGFSVNWNRCEITTDLGVTLNTELKVVVEDGRGLVLEASVGLVAQGSGSMQGVTGEEVVMGPVADLFREAPRRMIDEIGAAAAIPAWGTRPDETEVGQTVHHNESVLAFRQAVCRGMGLKDETELPPHPR